MDYALVCRLVRWEEQVWMGGAKEFPLSRVAAGAPSSGADGPQQTLLGYFGCKHSETVRPSLPFVYDAVVFRA